MYAYYCRFMRLVAFGLVYFYLSFVAVSSALANPLSPIRGASVVPSGIPTATVGASNAYVFDSSNPRYTFISASDRRFPVPTSTVATTYSSSAWSTFARRALARSGVGIGVVLVGAKACQYVDCSGVWGEPLDFNDMGISPDYNWGDGSLYSVVESVALTSNDPLSDGWDELGSTIHNLIETRLAQTTAGTGSNERPIATFLVSNVNELATHYQVQFRVRYAYTDQPYNCPVGSSPSSGRCVRVDSIPFDESLFADAQPVANTNQQFNTALWEEMYSEQVPSSISLSIDDVVETTIQQITTSSGVQTVDTTDTYSYPVTANDTASPLVTPTKTTVTDTYENGILVDSKTTVESGTTTGGLPSPSPSGDGVTDCDFSFDLICEYAAIIRYMVLMAAYLLSAQFIIRSIK